MTLHEVAVRALGWCGLVAVPGFFLVVMPRLTARLDSGHANQPRSPAPSRDDSSGLVLLPLQFIGGLAVWCWCLVCLAAFLAPLGGLAWLVLR